MADETIAALIPIEDGADAEAKPLRQNFKYLDDRITAQAANITNKESISHKGAANGYCPLDSNAKIPDNYLSEFSSEIDVKLDDINNDIEELSAAKISATASLEDSGNSGYCKLSNGLLIQWGWVSEMGNGSTRKITLPTPFVKGYIVVGSSTYHQTRGDKGSTWRAYDAHNLSWFTLGSSFEQWSASISWLAIGR